MRNRFVVFLALIAASYLKPGFVHAQEVKTTMAAVYDVEKNGVAKAEYNLTTENLYTEKYLKGFRLILNNVAPEDVRAFEGKEKLMVRSERIENNNIIEVDFNKAVVGKGSRRNFTISFSDKTFVTKIGEVWEVNLPQIKNSDEFEDYNIELRVPHEFGELAYISPEPIGNISTALKDVYYFNKEAGGEKVVSLAFGEFQVYSFNLTYHLENPLKKDLDMEIAIPPDSAFQKVIYEQFSSLPKNVFVDGDGNWIAIYPLKPRERKDVKIIGSVQIFSQPRSTTSTDEAYLKDTLRGNDAFWQISDPKIAELAKELDTPRKIYDFVVGKLSYNYERVKPNAKRFGALGALERPQESMCLEFTDLFVALARAAGIPAREVDGYAYTENPKIQPLSLVADVLHSWPEYWDDKKKTWIPVDPTWGSTTGGEDFFEKMDLRHFTFVIHGLDPEKPYSPGSYKLGANPEKDVYVSFGRLPENRTSHPEIDIHNQSPSFWPLKQKYEIELKNDGPVGIYDQRVEAYFDGKVANEYEVDVIPAKGKKSLSLEAEVGKFGLALPSKITVTNGQREVTIQTNKNLIILGLTTIVAVLLLICTAVVAHKIRKKR
jgi:hypothetical protein